MAAPTIAVLTDNFVRAPQAANAAGNPNGFGTANSAWAVNNGWLDVHGGAWKMPASGSVGCYANGVTPLAQDGGITPGPNQRIVATFNYTTVSSNFGYSVFLRGQPNTDCYYLILAYNVCGIAKATGGNFTQTTLASFTFTPTAGHNYSLDFTCTGDGATTTNLIGVVTDITTSTVIQTFNINDTTVEFQSGGRVGLLPFLGSGAVPCSYTGCTIYSDTAAAAPVYLGFIGDSQTYGFSTSLGSPADVCARIFSTRSPGTRYVALNVGQTQATTANWTAGNGSGYLANAIALFNLFGVKAIHLLLGGNDACGVGGAVTPAQYQANMQSIINSLNAAIPGVKIIVSFPPYFDAIRFNGVFGGVAANAYTQQLTSYFPTLAYLTGCVIGDTAAFTTFKAIDYIGLADGGHVNDIGCEMLASLWANAQLPYQAGTAYPDSVPISNLATGTAYVTIPWTIPATGLPGSTGKPQQGTTSYAVPVIGTSAQALCNVMDGLVSSGKAQII